MILTNRPFTFRRVYELAHIIEQTIESPRSFIEVGWDHPEVVEKVYKCSKLSLLHCYIYSMIFVEKHREYRKNSDLYDDQDIAEIERTLAEYEIAFVPFAIWKASLPTDTVYDTY